MKAPTVFRLALVCVFFAGLASATTIEPPEFTELVNRSDYIVRARVKTVTTEVRLREGHERLYTRIELDVLEVVAGNPPTPLVLTMLGGRQGEREFVVEGAPRFEVGHEDILFVRDNGRAINPLYAMMHGRYPVLRDTAKGRTYITRENLVPLLSTAEIVLPMSQGTAAEHLRRLVDPSRALTPAQFIQSIKAVRREGLAHEVAR